MTGVRLPTLMSAMTEDTAGKPTRAGAAVQSVDRALVVMEILAQLGSAGVTEIAAELGVHKSTVSRLIAVLESRGFVEQLSDRGKYRLGFTIVRLAGSTSAQMDLSRESQAICDRLAEQSGETINVAILDGDRIINIVESYANREVALRTWVGQNCPAHATSSGKALLSGLSHDQLFELLGAGPLERFTPNTVTSTQVLSAELDQTRDRGWAGVHEELEEGLNAVSAPIFGASGNVVAALSISAPAFRLAADGFEDAGKLAVAAAEQISRRLGHFG